MMSATPSRDKLRSLQALRFFAAFGVVCAHVGSLSWDLFRVQFGHWPQAGCIGVDVFFVLSGVVIGRTALFAADKPTAGVFLRRRWLRVAPIYWLLSAPAILTAALAGRPLIRPAIATFLFWLRPGVHTSFPFLSLGWTLCFEMLFYLGAALTLTRGGSRFVLPLAGAFLLAMAAFAFAPSPTVGFLGNPLILEFAAGVALSRWRPKADLAFSVFLALSAIVSFALMFNRLDQLGMGQVQIVEKLFQFPPAAVRVAVFGPPAVALVAAGLKLEASIDTAPLRGLARLGDASYSLYLVHPSVFWVLELAWPRLNFSPWSFAPLSLVLSVITSVIIYRTIERPMLTAFNRMTSARTPVPLMT